MTIDAEHKPFGSHSSRLLNFIYSNAYNKKIPGELRKVIKEKMPVDSCIDKESRGIKMRLFPSQNFHDMLFASGFLFEFEKDTFSFIDELLNDQDVLIDIGANTGTICIPISLWNPNIRCLAIEANPVLFQRLDFNVSTNDLSNIDCLNLAVGGSSDVAELCIENKRNLGSGSLLDGNTLSKYTFKTTSLSEILHRNNVNKPIIVKIDIEGYEDRVLMPFLRSEPNHLWPKAVVIEHKNKYQWKENCIDFMLSCGYRKVKENNIDAMLIYNNQ